MKNKLLLSILFFTSFLSQSQSFEWLATPEITYGANGTLISYSTTFDPVGNVYMAGFKENVFPYGEVFGDCFFNKYDADGNLLFTKMINGHAAVYNMVSDQVGNILMAVGFVETITIGEVTITTQAQGIKAILLKFDSAGNLIFHEQLVAASGNIERFTAIATDATDNIYIGFANGQNAVIQKRSASGSLLNTITQLNVESVTSISIDSDENILVAGACAAVGATFAGVNVNSNLQYNSYIVKYDSSGTFQWVKYVNDVTCSMPVVKAATPNNIYFSSPLYEAYLFDDIQTEGPPANSYSDIFIAKLNANGAYQWVREVPGNTGGVQQGKRNYLSTDSDNNVYFAGSTRGTIQWTPTIATTIAGFNDDSLILKFEANGDLTMAKTAGGSGFDRFDAISVNDAGEIAVTGISYNTATFDSFVHEVAVAKPYPILGKISSAPLSTITRKNNNIVIYPNPSRDYIHIANANQNYSGAIFNIIGQRIMDFKIGPNMPVSVQMIPKGTYLLKLDGEITQKFIRN